MYPHSARRCPAVPKDSNCSPSHGTKQGLSHAEDFWHQFRLFFGKERKKNLFEFVENDWNRKKLPVDGFCVQLIKTQWHDCMFVAAYENAFSIRARCRVCLWWLELIFFVSVFRGANERLANGNGKS